MVTRSNNRSNGTKKRTRARIRVRTRSKYIPMVRIPRRPMTATLPYVREHMPSADTPGAEVIRKLLRTHKRAAANFLEAARKIEKYPHSYDQSTFGIKSESANTPCGTVACLAGQYLMACGLRYVVGKGYTYSSGRRLGSVESMKFSRDMGINKLSSLDLSACVYTTYDDDPVLVSCVVSYMFSGDGNNWPYPFNNMFEDAALVVDENKRSISYAIVAAARIRHFVKYGQ